MLRHEHYVRAALPWEDPDVELPDPLLILNPPDETTEHAK
jgi:hypothetical protein